MTPAEGTSFVEALTSGAAMVIGSLYLLRVMVAFLRKGLNAGSDHHD